MLKWWRGWCVCGLLWRKMVDCWMSSFFMSLCSQVKTNPHETGALVRDLLAGSLWEVIWRLSVGCHCISSRCSKTKNRGASWENSERSLTHKPQRRGVQEPRYKSIEMGESDHTLFVRALLLSFPCRPSPVRWGCGKKEKQTLITIRAPRPSWGHAESLAPGEGIRTSPSSLIKQCEESNAC